MRTIIFSEADLEPLAIVEVTENYVTQLLAGRGVATIEFNVVLPNGVLPVELRFERLLHHGLATNRVFALCLTPRANPLFQARHQGVLAAYERKMGIRYDDPADPA